MSKAATEFIETICRVVIHFRPHKNDDREQEVADWIMEYLIEQEESYPNDFLDKSELWHGGMEFPCFVFEALSKELAVETAKVVLKKLRQNNMTPIEDQ